MVTKLTRPVTRLIGNRVVTMTDEGIVIRARRKHGTTLYRYEDLLPPARNRQEAFGRPAPRNWEPAPGQKVWLRDRQGHAGSLRTRGLIVAVLTGFPDLMLKIKVQHGGKWREFTEEIQDVRPI